MKYTAFSRPVILRFLLLVLLALAARSASAQGSAADRARLQQGQATLPGSSAGGVSGEGVDQNYAAASPNDADLGEQAILKRVEEYEPFTLDVGTPFYYTSNVALVNRGAEGDVIFAPVVALTYAPKFGRTLYGEFVVRQQFFYYNKFTGFNFASFDVLAGLAYYVGELQAGRRTLQSITLDVLNGASTPPDSTVVANKIDVADHYTGKVALGCPYGTELTGLNALASVTSDAATAWSAKLAIESQCAH